MDLTATATTPIEATASSDAHATLLATATSETSTTQQTQTAEAQTPPATETTATITTETHVTPQVPEKYEFKAPEGVSYDPQVLESFSGAAKEAGLTQDAAQKLIDNMAPAIAARQADQMKAIHAEWQNASTVDKEIGGEKLQENLGVAKRALDTFDPQPIGADGKPVPTPLRTLLEQTGLGNHPEILRFMYRTGKAISEDKFVGGSQALAGKPNPAKILYDKTVQK